MFTMLELSVLFVLFNYHDDGIELANDIALKLPDAETLLLSVLFVMVKLS